jgi:8-oxo-dGTP diphosphatase
VRRLGTFQRYLYADDLDRWLRKVCHVYLARPALRIGDPGELGHSAVWMPVKAAAISLAGRANLYYLRERRGKSARIVEKTVSRDKPGAEG